MQNEERINGLETQVRTLKRIVYGFGCLLVAGIVVSATSVQTVPDVIQAKKFEVVNDEGKVVVDISSEAFYGGGGSLTVRNGKQLGSDDSYASVMISPFSIGIHSKKDMIELVALYGHKNGGMLRISNNDGKFIGGISVDENGGGVFRTR